MWEKILIRFNYFICVYKKQQNNFYNAHLEHIALEIRLKEKYIYIYINK